MHYLIYISSASYALSDSALLDILENSRKNNSAKNITGILIYMDGNILQLLEGEEAIIKSIYKKITLDERHTGIIKIKEGDEIERIFPDWSMGFKAISSQHLEEFTGYKKISDFNIDSSIIKNGQHPALTFLKSFLKNNRL